MTCWLAQHHVGPCLTRADGQYDRAHLIPQRRIKATLHHGLLDGKAIRLRASDYPPELHEFAAEYGFAYDEGRREWFALAERKEAA